MPNSNSELYILHAWEDNPIYLKCVQGESGIKIAKFQLVDHDGVINLTGNTGVNFVAIDGKGNAVSAECTIDNASTGLVSLTTSTAFTKYSGRVDGYIVVGFANNQNVQFDSITVLVKPNKAIEALIHDDAFATFWGALQRLKNIESGEVTDVDESLDTSSTNPVQNTAVATAINNIINRLDGSEFVKVVTNNDADACNQANILYKLYINGMYHYAFCSVATNQLTQYVFKQNGGIIFRTAPATSGSQSGAWGDFKEVAIKGTSLADYGITDAYTKSQTYNKDEVDSKISSLSGTVASNKSAIESRVSTVEGTVSGHTSAIGNLQDTVSQHTTDINNLTQAVIDKMDKDFLSVTSFMCDEDGTIFAATDDTVLTNQSFENQDKTENPYFIWIANTVTEVQSNAFVNTGKIVKIYCENTSTDTPLPVNYQSLPVEYGFNSLFAYYIMRSLVTLFNDKANKNVVNAALVAKEVKSNKKTTLTGNESSNDFYPTTKAVADALEVVQAGVHTIIEEEVGDLKSAFDVITEGKKAEFSVNGSANNWFNFQMIHGVVYILTNNTSAACAFKVQDANGTQETIAQPITGGASWAFYPTKDYVKVGGYFNEAGTMSVEVTTGIYDLPDIKELENDIIQKVYSKEIEIEFIQGSRDPTNYHKIVVSSNVCVCKNVIRMKKGDKIVISNIASGQYASLLTTEGYDSGKQTSVFSHIASADCEAVVYARKTNSNAITPSDITTKAIVYDKSTRIHSCENDILDINGRFMASVNMVNSNWVCGKYENGIYYDRSSAGTGNNIAMPPTVQVTGGEVYTLSWKPNQYASSTYYYMYEFDSNGDYLDIYHRVLGTADHITAALNDNCVYVGFMGWINSGTNNWANAIPEWTQFQQGEKTSYESEIVIKGSYLSAKGIYEKLKEDGYLDGKSDIPSYYNQYMAEKANRINTIASGCVGDGDAFIFITDEHWLDNAKNSPALISFINQHCHINRLFDGGDIANGIENQYCDKMRNAFPHKIYHVVGNHEYLEDGNNNSLYYAFDMYNNDQIGDALDHYWYVDNNQQKIRYIILSSFSRSGSDVVAGYSEAEKTWIQNVALNVDDGWDIIVFTHAIGTHSGYPYDINNAVRNILDNFNANHTTEKVLAIFQGHMHFDGLYNTLGGIPIITNTCDKYVAWINSQGNQEPWITEYREANTITEQAFDVVILDRTNKVFHSVRIGVKAMNNYRVPVGDDATYFAPTPVAEERIVHYEPVSVSSSFVLTHTIENPTTWGVSDNNVISVNNGTVSAVGTGKAFVYASNSSGYYEIWSVLVE